MAIEAASFFIWPEYEFLPPNIYWVEAMNIGSQEIRD
jgi:hypothetical protein